MKSKDVDIYIDAFPDKVKKRLKEMRKIIHSAAPAAIETISYKMPAYKLNGKPLVYFSGYENHIGLYATPTGHAKFKKELSVYKQGKGSVQFPLDEPIPFDLIKRIVEFRVTENSNSTKRKTPLKKKESVISSDILAYNETQNATDRKICEGLYSIIMKALPGADSKIWHAHPVWFLDGNPVVGYSKLKDSVRVLFWSGQSFEEPGLTNEGKFKAAEARYTSADQIREKDLKRWLKKARDIQWDYKNLVKRKGELLRLK